MKKFLKLFSVFVLSIAIFGITKSVKANSINKISMDIYVNSNGDATISEIWDCNATQGTEIYLYLKITQHIKLYLVGQHLLLLKIRLINVV